MGYRESHVNVFRSRAIPVLSCREYNRHRTASVAYCANSRDEAWRHLIFLIGYMFPSDSPTPC